MVFSSLSVGELGLLVTLCGVIIVFIVLVILVACISAFGAVMQIGNKKPKKADTAVNIAETAVTSAPSVNANDNGEIIAVIAAAVDALYEGSGKRAVVRSVKPSSARVRSAWATAGLEQNVRSF